MNESETRAGLIDPALKAAGWGTVEGSRILREYRIALADLGRAEEIGKVFSGFHKFLYRETEAA